MDDALIGGRRARRRSVARALRAAGAAVAIAAIAVGCSASSQSATPTTNIATEPPMSTVPSDQAITGDTPCPAADGSARRVILFEKAPPTCIDPSKTYVAQVHTNLGDFEITLDAHGAPKNVNNFVVLARYHYFDDLPFDQSSPRQYIGSGVHPPPAHPDPGYLLPSEVPANKDLYKVPGTVIIDNGNAGGDGATWIALLTDGGVSPRFTILGTVTTGLDVATLIGNAGQAPANTATPKVETVRIVES